MGLDNRRRPTTRGGTGPLSQDHTLGHAKLPHTGTRTQRPGQPLKKPGEYRRPTTRNTEPTTPVMHRLKEQKEEKNL